ncbi:hypothetical protein AMTR_s00091p00144220 [Amborella trichopoda]|uniref:Uncharacterized protein n=1 Tax=Amborella trichopoda TaxID=13333 RepID=W1P0Z8_AMBTC|nr:hypothetical protein AMTR_s00091p00144220 [Amborella trichopoda]
MFIVWAFGSGMGGPVYGLLKPKVRGQFFPSACSPKLGSKLPESAPTQKSMTRHELLAILFSAKEARENKNHLEKETRFSKKKETKSEKVHPKKEPKKEKEVEETRKLLFS